MANLQKTRTPDQTRFIEALIPAQINEMAWGKDLRQEHTQALENLSFPTRKSEGWKYTQLRGLFKESYQWYSGEASLDLEPYLIPNWEGDIMVFLNGVYQAQWSDLSRNQDQLLVKAFSQLSEDELAEFNALKPLASADQSGIFGALNAAGATEGVWIKLKRGQQAAAPIHILHLSQANDQPLGQQHRNVIQLEASAEAQVVESFYALGEGKCFRNDATDIHVGPNAGLEWIKLQLQSKTSTAIDTTEVHLADDCRFGIYTLTFGGQLIRNNLHLSLDGQNIEAKLMGTYLLDGQQHVDNFTQVDHRKPNSYSNELYKGIMDETATGVFSGRIHVYQEAQKTNAYQSNRNILLTDRANIYTRPQLEIYADDVKCSHGATTGKLEEDAMFYLQARGIPADEARKMLIHAYVMEVVDHISLDSVREMVDALIQARY
ncbi:MAG: Fe-S cluster assembly protein SufD [Bacteroidota bacterium]